MFYENVPNRGKNRNGGCEDGGSTGVAALNCQEKCQLSEKYKHTIKQDIQRQTVLLGSTSVC